MNDVLREMEEVQSKRDKRKKNFNNKKVLMYILIGAGVLLLVGGIIYLVIINKENYVNNDDVSIEKDNDEVKEEYKKITYVSCDDNTALLNVRNGTSGDIIDGLSCYKEVTVLEELEETEVCDKWYKVSYQKRGNNYTGYTCGNYIKESVVDENNIIKLRELIDKVNDYYEVTRVKPYCGNTSDSKKVSFKDEEGTSSVGKYVKSEYKNIDEIKNYLSSFLEISLLKSELKLADYNNPKQYDDYYEIEGDLYCRDYEKEYKSNYTGNYDFEVVSFGEDKTIINISYEYLIDDSKCDIKDLSDCTNSNFKYDFGKIVVENNIITKMDFHK